MGTKTTNETSEQLDYFDHPGDIVNLPSRAKMFISRLMFPVLVLLSREQTIRLGLTPIDDERVIMALKHARGKVLDIGCGANIFVRSHGQGIGVDVAPWKGCDKVIDDAGMLPFKNGEFDTVSYLACLNHIPNREESLKEAHRVTRKGGQILVTMITPRMGAFIHWLRFRNDPDHQERHIDHEHELMGMAPEHVKRLLEEAGFSDVRRKRFVYGLNSIYTARKD
jgi:ubiquinone/menaquinone biosynthesis C-methylase UbiE